MFNKTSTKVQLLNSKLFLMFRRIYPRHLWRDGKLCRVNPLKSRLVNMLLTGMLAIYRKAFHLRKPHCSPHTAPVTQNATSKSRTRSYENLVDVAVSDNFGQFWLGRASYGVWLSAAVPLLKHCQSAANDVQSLNTRFFPRYQRVTPVRWPCSARDRPINFRSYRVSPSFNHCRNTDYHVCFTYVARLYHVCRPWLSAG